MNESNKNFTINNAELSFKDFLEKIQEESGIPMEEFPKYKIMCPVLDLHTYYLIKKNCNVTYTLAKRTEEELKDQSYMIELKSINENLVEIQTELNEFYAKTNITQYYVNHSNEPVELTLKFPYSSDIQFSKFTLEMNDKKVISKVIDKEKAEEKYNDAIASGNTGVLSSQEDKYIKVNIGNINARGYIKLTTEFIQFLKSEDMSYCYTTMKKFPMIEVGEDKNKKNKNKKGKFSKNTTKDTLQKVKANIKIKAHSKILRLITKGFSKTIKKNFNEDYTQCDILYDSSNDNKKDNKNDEFKILFRTLSMNNLNLISQYDPNKNETSCILSMIYNKEDIKIPIKEIPDTDNNNNYTDLYQKNIINNTPSLFIFLIDQSGSMGGKPIKIVSNTLIFFLQSLPKGSYYQLIGFGSSINYIFSKKPVEYTTENVKGTISILKKLEANLGGTELYKPLEKIFKNNNYNDIKLGRNLFILTDGQVWDREESLNIIKKNLDIYRVHSFGIGDDFDKEFIISSGKNGSYCFIENISKIKSNVIRTLNESIRSYLFGSKISVKNLNLEYTYIPNDKICYQDEFLNFYFIIKNKINDVINIDLQFYDKNKLAKKELIFDIKNIICENEGDIISKIIIGNILNNNTSLDIGKDKNIELAKKYQVLSKFTSLYAEIENEFAFKDSKELRSVEQKYIERKEDKKESDSDSSYSDDDSISESSSDDGRRYKKRMVKKKCKKSLCVKKCKKKKIDSSSSSSEKAKKKCKKKKIINSSSSSSEEKDKKCKKKKIESEDDEEDYKAKSKKCKKKKGESEDDEEEISSDREEYKKKNKECKNKSKYGGEKKSCMKKCKKADSDSSDSESSGDEKNKSCKLKSSLKEKRKKDEESESEDKQEFDIEKMVLTQDIMNGNWTNNNQTDMLIDLNKAIYDKIKQYVEKFDIKENKDDVIITILVIYYLKNNQDIDQTEYIIIINKGLEYLQTIGIEELLYKNIEPILK